MPRRLLLVTVGPDEVDLVTDVLWSVGVDAIEERQTPDGVTLVTEATESLVDAVGRRWPFRLVDVDLAESLDAWRPWAVPTVLERQDPDGPVVIRAPWTRSPTGGAGVEVVIDPGHAWGHGGHPSTAVRPSCW